MAARTQGETGGTEQVAHNFLWNLSVGGWGVLLALFATPYVVHRLGPERYGIYALLGVLVTYLAFSELGLGRAVERHGAAALGAGQPQRLRAYFETALWLQAGLAVLLGALLVTLGPFALELFKIPDDRLAEATLATRVIGLSFAVNLLLGTAQAPLRAHQAFATLGRIGLVSQTLTTGLLVGAVYLRPTVVAVVGALAIASFLRLLLTLAVTLRRLGGLRFRVDRTNLEDLVGFGGSLTASSLLSPILGHAEKLLLGAFVGASALTYYMVPFRVLSRFGLVAGALSRALFPRLSTLQGQGRRDSMWRGNVRATHLLAWVLLPPFAVLGIAGETLLALWMGPEFAAQAAPVLPFLILGAFVNLLAWNAVALIQAHGRPILVAKAYVVETVVYLPVAWLLMSRFGLVGAALTWCFRAVLDAVLLWGIAAALFRPVRRGSPSVVRPSTSLLGVGLVGVGLAVGAATSSVLGNLTVAAIVALFVLAVAWRYVFDRKERQLFLGVFRRLRPSTPNPGKPIQRGEIS